MRTTTARFTLDAMKRCLRISEEMGAAAIVLDVLQDAAFEWRWRFYEGLGFRALGDAGVPGRMFVSMGDVRASLIF